jgi:hypothetical protein
MEPKIQCHKFCGFQGFHHKVYILLVCDAVLEEYRHTSTTLHSVTFQKTVISIRYRIDNRQENRYEQEYNLGAALSWERGCFSTSLSYERAFNLHSSRRITYFSEQSSSEGF